MPLYRVSSGGASGLPTGGAPGQLLGQDDEGEVIWVDLPTASFRGDWALDQQVFVEDFQVGISSPFTAVATGVGAQTPDIQDNDNEAAGKPFTKRVRCWAQPSNTLGSKSSLVLDVASLGITKQLTRVSFWMRSGYDGFPQNGKLSVSTGSGTELWSRGGNENVAWTKQSVSVPSSVSELRFEHTVINNIGDGRAQSYFGFIELFAVDSPYMAGQFVTSNGKMWKSLVNNNSGTPGTDVSWVEALTLPVESGTTAQRPSAATAGPGFQYYDTTLDKPTWSDGTAWRDAVGTAV